MALFDAYIFVDWSAANGLQPQQPASDAVWVGELIPGLALQRETYHRSRRHGISHVTSRLAEHVRDNRRVLIGFDFPYGYPTGFAKALHLPSGAQSWWQIWAELAYRISDGDDNANNRFAAAADLNRIAGNGQPGPFWGCPAGGALPNLSPQSPGFPFQGSNGVWLQRLRLVEHRLRGVQEAWGLFGAGRVGSQALVGLPYLYQLRRNLELVTFSRVWPFETGFTETPSPQQGASILHAEIWPGVVEPAVRQLVAADPTLIRDQAQVRAMCAWAAEHDANHTLAQFFALPNQIDPGQLQICVQEEGWILGAR